MAHSAVPSLREARKHRTQSALISAARRLTHEHGLGGYTVDFLCEEVGVSRRTFFNYFAGKEDAVLGIGLDSPFADYLPEFFASKEHNVPLVKALFDLLRGSYSTMLNEEFSPEVIIQTIAREPGLLERMKRHGHSQIDELAEHISTREGLEPKNSYAHTVALAAHHMALSTLIDQNDPTHTPHPTALHQASFDLQMAVYNETLGRNLHHLAHFLAPLLHGEHGSEQNHCPSPH